MKTSVICFLVFLSTVNGFSFFAEKIPNGEFVPHPCKPNFLWKGVGHKNKDGGGERNQFGRDFLNFGKIWSESLCRMDSDGDGKSNGEELGDPNCVWREGDIPQFMTGITHPGVCDPMNATICLEKNTWVDCSLESFQCQALRDDPDIKNMTLTFPKTPVPVEETNYYCMAFEFPQDGDYHMIATEPIIDNIHVMHHILLFGCTKKPPISTTEPQHCGMGLGDCLDVIGGWTVGATGECLHKDIGFRLGQHGYSYGILQFHWNNPLKRSDYVDGSGLMIHYTPNKRIADAGVFVIGQNFFEIPPQQEEVHVTGRCNNLALNGPINITRAINHMHYLGRKMTIEHFRGEDETEYITNEPDYSYDSPKLYSFSNPIVFKPGDTLKTTCVFKSTGKKKTVFYGDGTNDEMCLGFLTYYPKQNIQSPFCVSFKDIDQMQLFTSEEYKSCRHWDFLLSLTEEMRHLKNQVIENCQPLRGCLSECQSTVKLVKRHPCITEDVGSWIKNAALFSLDQRVNRTEMETFYLGLSSCDVWFESHKNDDNSSNNGSQLTLSLFLYLFYTMYFFVTIMF